MKSIDARLRAIERQRGQHQHGPFVFRTIEEARAAGATGCVLIVGDLMDEAEWVKAARAQQAGIKMEKIPP